ncbi:hypothetical protein CEXT_814331 [Caerostris extrusa]|uniref:Uncharacterized protein n=1 Tax=Caerostris extrusa TaxID=172846 RepID=A0AAV4QUW5_CAEEX|nr:hypothetical protein CEXT_814331 [Caerostris extrusa]
MHRVSVSENDILSHLFSKSIQCSCTYFNSNIKQYYSRCSLKLEQNKAVHFFSLKVLGNCLLKIQYLLHQLIPQKKHLFFQNAIAEQQSAILASSHSVHCHLVLKEPILEGILFAPNTKTEESYPTPPLGFLDLRLQMLVLLSRILMTVTLLA